MMEKFHEFLQRRTCLIVLLHHYLFFTAKASFNIMTAAIPFSKGFSPLFGEGNIYPLTDDNGVRLHLNQYTGSGFQSSDIYRHGLFSARIKLPGNYTAGIVVAFYATNGHMFQMRHDEIDFEFLGNIRRKPWRFQTNMYGNGSTGRGREERFYLWFDPSKEFHRYSILWTAKNIIFYIDDVPIREIVKNDAMGGDYPLKPMALYATIWDASDWATCGGKYKVNYKYAPFVVEFTDLLLHGCTVDPIQASTRCDGKDGHLQSVKYASVTPRQRAAMRKFRRKYMYYSYCYDTQRYAISTPECAIDPVEKLRFKNTGRLKFKERHILDDSFLLSLNEDYE